MRREFLSQLRQPSYSAVLKCAMTAGLLAGAGGCAGGPKYHLSDTSCVSTNLTQRFGKPIGPSECPRQIVYPNGVSLNQTLTEEGAVLLALWNNALFLETLTDLGIAQGDLVQAGLLPNPEVVYFFPVTDKPFKYLFDFPLESLWLRPIRVAAAESEANRVCSRLTQAGIDLIRDTRQAYADVVLAYGRREVAFQAVSIRASIAGLAKTRLEAGDISAQEASTSLIDVHIAEQEAARANFDIGIAEERLRNLMGVSPDRTPLKVVLTPTPYPALPCVEPLVAEATTSRPDAQAAAQSAAAAAERVRLAKIGWVRFLGILDATSGVNGHEFSPAGRVTLPIFNRNQGGIARAEAELEKAERQRQTVNNQIIQDVHQSHLRYAQAQAELKILSERTRPEAEAAIKRTELAYREGNTPYVIVLQTTQQLLSSRLRSFQLQAELMRNWAELERSVGRHLDDVSHPLPEAVPVPPIPPAQSHEAAPVQLFPRQ